MKRNFTTMLGLMFLAGTSMPLCASVLSSASVLKRIPMETRMAVTEHRDVPMVSVKSLPKLDLGENEKWRGYFNGDFKDNTMPLGVESAGAYNCCIKVPSIHEVMGKGMTIEGLSFSFPSRHHLDSVYIWISEELPSRPTEATIAYQMVPVAKLNDLKSGIRKNNEVRFEKPYMLGDKDVYVGYSFVVKEAETPEAKNPVLVSKYPQNTDKNALFFNAPGEEWTDMSGYPFGNLAVQLLMSRKTTQNAVSVQPCLSADLAGKVGTEENVTLKFKNEGEKGCAEFAYVVSNGSTQYAEQVVHLEEAVTGVDKGFEYTIPVPINEYSGKDTLMVKVTKVNGVDNESVSHTQCNGNMFALSKVVDHNVFVEYFVGTWDGHSPRAYVSMDLITEKYGDRAVIAAVHAGKVEAMECADYTKMSNYYKGTTGFPTSFVDRTINNIYPYWGEEIMSDFGFEDCFLQVYNKVALADITVEGFVNEDDILEVKSTTDFLCENPNGDYGVGYVLTADSLTGEGAGWDQENQMVDFKDAGIFDAEPRFAWWMNGDKVVKGFVFNNVAIAAQGMLTKGLENSLAAPFKENAPQVHTISFNLKDYPLVKDLSKLSVCAVVFDRKNGFIVNADKKLVQVANAVGELTVEPVQALEVARYSLSGQRLLAPAKGVNLVRLSDGSVKKVVVK